jgi:hypothetical protein
MKINVYDTPEKINEVVSEIKEKGIMLHQYGMMYQWWNNPDTVKALAIAEINGEKVGAVFVSKHHKVECMFNIGVFVTPYHRRKGIGGKLLKSIKDTDSNFRVDGSGFRTKMFSKYLDGKINGVINDKGYFT